MLGIIEKYFLKRPISLKAEIGILLGFVFFACFQAWEDEYKLLSAKPASNPNIQVNVPPITVPPAQVVIPQQRPEHLAQLNFNNPVPLNAGKFQLLTAGKASAFNVSLVNQGPYTAEKTKAMWTLSIFDIPPSVTNAGEVTKIAHKQFKDSLSQIPEAAKHAQVSDLDPGRSLTNTVYTTGLFTEDLIKRFQAENAAFLVLGYAEWHDSAGKHTKFSCLWITIFTGTDSLDGWHICD